VCAYLRNKALHRRVLAPFAHAVIAAESDSVGLGNYLQIYEGVFVCETTSQPLRERKNALKKAASDYRVQFSDEHQSLTKEWHWCFASISRTTD
jgi:hypothetical protein